MINFAISPLKFGRSCRYRLVDAMKMFAVTLKSVDSGRKSMKDFPRESLFESSPIHIEALIVTSSWNEANCALL